MARCDRAGRRAPRLLLSVGQAGGALPPAVLTRFRTVVDGRGHVSSRQSGGMYVWRASRRADAEEILRRLWPYLGPVKRAQAARALGVVCGVVPADPSSVRERVLQLAWAAGFLDADGSFGVSRKMRRTDGVQALRIRVSASQHGAEDRPAEVLTRLCAVLGVGRIERHGDPDDHRWVAEGETAVRAVLAQVRPFLGTVRRSQAEAALARYAARPRARGDRERCLRGHPYDRRRRNGRGVCLTCRRLRERLARAAQGIAPRAFRDPRRRYTDHIPRGVA